jgi:hypothetical protein
MEVKKMDIIKPEECNHDELGAFWRDRTMKGWKCRKCKLYVPDEEWFNFTIEEDKRRKNRS